MIRFRNLSRFRVVLKTLTRFDWLRKSLSKHVPNSTRLVHLGLCRDGLQKRNVLRNRLAAATIGFMNKLTWVDYLNRLPNNPSDRSIAAAAETSPSTVSRWRGGQSPDPIHVTRVARAFGQDALSALFNAGYLTLEEIDELVSGTATIHVLALAEYDTVELAEELARRLREGEA